MRIALQPYKSLPSYGSDLQNARLRIEVVEAVGITPAVFMHERYTILKAQGPIQENRFISVAKPGDLNIFPVSAPDAAQGLPFFRLDCVDMTFNSSRIMDETYGDILEEVTQLVQAMKHLEELQSMDLVIIEA